jgi:hypothetical protein
MASEQVERKCPGCKWWDETPCPECAHKRGVPARLCPSCGQQRRSTNHDRCDWCWVHRDKSAARSGESAPGWSGFLRQDGAA